MQIFLTGTDTDVGKTIVSSWLCLQTGYDYFKPIQSGLTEEIDSEIVSRLSGSKIHPEVYQLRYPLSPHKAARLDGKRIEISRIQLPKSDNVIIEGAGGVLVPLNEKDQVVDLIDQFKIPVILVSSTRLGTINHTLLSLEALRNRSIEVIGIIMVGEDPLGNKNEIEVYGRTKVLATLPIISPLNSIELRKIPLSHSLKAILEKTHEQNTERA